MTAQVIDGKAFAAKLRERVGEFAATFAEKAGRKAGLARMHGSGQRDILVRVARRQAKARAVARSPIRLGRLDPFAA